MKLERQNLILFLLVGMVLLAFGAWRFSATLSFVTSAVRAQGRVIERRNVGRARHVPVIRFRTRAGQEITFVARPTAWGAEVGSAVTVLYDEDLPGEARLDDLALWFNALLLGLAGAGFVTASILLLKVEPSRQRARRRRLRNELRQSGVRVMSTLARVEGSRGLGGSRVGPWHIVSIWKDPATGQVHEFWSPSLRSDPTRRLASNAITVLVDRTDPRRYAMALAPVLRRRTRAPRREEAQQPDATPAAAVRQVERPRPAASAPPRRRPGFLERESKVAGVGIGAISTLFGAVLAAVAVYTMDQPGARFRASVLLPFALGFALLGVAVVVRTLRDQD